MGMAFLCGVALLAGCAQLPSQSRATGLALAATIDRTSHAVEGFERDHQALLTRPENAAIRAFAEEAGFEQSLREARGHVERARSIDRDRVQVLLRENRPEGAEPLMKAAKEAKDELELARAEMGKVEELRTELLRASSDLAGFGKRGAATEAELNVRDRALVAAIQPAKEKHAHKREDLGRRLAAFRALASDVHTQRATIDSERSRSAPHLLRVVQADGRLKASAKEAERLAADLEKRVVDLNRSVTRRLEDMRLDYKVTFGRSSWDEYSDWEGENVVSLKPVPVSLDMAQRLSNLGSETVDASIVRQAGADPFLGLLSNERSYEFWIEDVDDQAFHRYVETVDGVATVTDWISVSDEVFERHEKDLGMEIFVKPYGAYEEEAVTTATPPGLALVGNSRYGRWNGSTWHWIAPYLVYSRLFDGNHYYRRDEWNLWNRSFRNQRGYYGPGEREEERAYGTNGRLARVYYGNSTWGRTTGFRSHDLSFRGLGPEYRGGGPGGGGK